MSVKSLRLLLRLGALAILIIIIIYALSTRFNIKGVASDLNEYSNLILALLTAVLVGITGFYAWITNNMFEQMKESRQSLVRPILWVTFDRPEFKETVYTSGGKDTQFCTKAHISNYGKGAAVNIRTQYTVPNEWSDEYKCVMPIATSGAGEIPSLLIPGNSFDVKVQIPTKTFDVKELYPTYLTARVLYEDTERNLYELKQSYYLLSSPILDKAYHYLHIETESLYFLPFSDRTNVRDDTESISSQGIVIFSRRLSWRWR